MSNKKEEKKKNFIQNNKTLILFIIGVILLLFFLVFLFTRESISYIFDFTETGQIGDTIAGITSPIIGLFGAVLVYVSFKEQVEANRAQREALSIEIQIRKDESNANLVITMFDQLREEYNSIKFDDGSKEYKGRQAIDAFSKIFIDRIDNKEFQNNTIIAEIMYLLSLILDLNERIKKNTLEKPFGESIRIQLLLFYSSKFSPYLNGIVYLSLKEEHPLFVFLRYTMLAHTRIEMEISDFKKDIIEK